MDVECQGTKASRGGPFAACSSITCPKTTSYSTRSIHVHAMLHVLSLSSTANCSIAGKQKVDQLNCSSTNDLNVRSSKAEIPLIFALAHGSNNPANLTVARSDAFNVLPCTPGSHIRSLDAWECHNKRTSSDSVYFYAWHSACIGKPDRTDGCCDLGLTLHLDLRATRLHPIRQSPPRENTWELKYMDGNFSKGQGKRLQHLFVLHQLRPTLSHTRLE